MSLPRQRIARIAPWLLLALAAGVAVRIGLSADSGLAAMSDARIYRAGAVAWWNGEDLYNSYFHGGGNPARYTYPPFSVVPLGAILALYPLGVLLLTAGSVGLLFHIMLLVLDRLRPGVPHRHLIAAIATLCAVQLEPVTQTLFWGQINILLLWLVAFDCLHRHPRLPRGVLVGVAAALKLTPVVFVLFFFLGKEFKPVLNAVSSFVVCTGLGWLIAPRDSFTYWTSAVWLPGRVGNGSLAGNQSLRGMLTRLGLTGGSVTLWWLALGTAVVAVAVVIVFRYRGAGRDVPAFLTTAAAGTLLSPMSWSHHWVWLCPLLFALALKSEDRPRTAVPALTVAGGAAVLAPHWRYSPSPDAPWWTHVAGESYPWVALGMLVFFAVLMPGRQSSNARPVTVPASTPGNGSLPSPR
ncbi:glycosyltransferase 87 family protein [Amycolatopsis sp. NPDC049868]|uniref:glycosyltransferase 87 family protein n=1 Tax=Amycolatopsis sp. NPDC049868 TaxID=3363934 RepID=UPI00379DD03C